jgi:hypothetical protein
VTIIFNGTAQAVQHHLAMVGDPLPEFTAQDLEDIDREAREWRAEFVPHTASLTVAVVE